jgi:hypothetical protein
MVGLGSVAVVITSRLERIAGRRLLLLAGLTVACDVIPFDVLRTYPPRLVFLGMFFTLLGRWRTLPGAPPASRPPRRPSDPLSPSQGRRCGRAAGGAGPMDAQGAHTAYGRIHDARHYPIGARPIRFVGHSPSTPSSAGYGPGQVPLQEADCRPKSRVPSVRRRRDPVHAEPCRHLAGC